jgi:hypothetical protein
MPLCGEENLRVVVLFPVNQRGEDLMMGAPSEASPRRLGGAAYSGGQGSRLSFTNYGLAQPLYLLIEYQSSDL